MSEEFKDFINKVLDKNPATRLGAQGGVDELLAHPWLSTLDSNDILAKKIEAPMKPKLSNDPLDVSNFEDGLETVQTYMPDNENILEE